MENLPIGLRHDNGGKTVSVEVDCDQYREKEFTMYILSSDFRQSLLAAMNLDEEVDYQMQFDIDRSAILGRRREHDVRLDEYRNLFNVQKHFDFSGKILFRQTEEPSLKVREGRVHAALCFDGAFFSVTVRAEKRNNGSPSAKGQWKAWDKRKDYEKKKEILPEILPAHELVNEQIQVLGEVFRESGLVLVSGATGSGKTTCLGGLLAIYLLRRLKNVERRPHLVVIGDPIETAIYKKGTNRNEKWDGTFQNGLQQEPRPFDLTSRTLGLDVDSVEQALTDAMRETPSAVVVSELRSDADFRAALRFAATGHLIFATSHNTSLVDTFEKLLEVTNADTAAKRSSLAQRLRAVVHLREICGERVPCLWKPTPAAVTSFVAEGLASLIAGGADNNNRAVMGRYFMAKRILNQKEYQYLKKWAKEHSLGDQTMKKHFLLQALKSDLVNA